MKERGAHSAARSGSPVAAGDAQVLCGPAPVLWTCCHGCVEPLTNAHNISSTLCHSLDGFCFMSVKKSYVKEVLLLTIYTLGFHVFSIAWFLNHNTMFFISSYILCSEICFVWHFFSFCSQGMSFSLWLFNPSLPSESMSLKQCKIPSRLYTGNLLLTGWLI